MEGFTRVYLIRHGQVENFETLPIYGHTDLMLNETGRVQIQRVAQILRFCDVAAVYCSDLSRAVDSARIVAAFHDVPIFPLKELREVYLGQWEGHTFEYLRKNFSKELDERQNDILNFRPPGNGETLLELSQRVMDCYLNILERHRGRGLVVVAHGAVNRVILCHALGMDLRYLLRIQQDYGCLNVIDYYGEVPLVRLVNG